MTTTYTGDMTIPRDRTRFEIGDRGPDGTYVASGGRPFLLTDEEIAGVLTRYGITTSTDAQFLMAAAACAEAIAGLFTSSVSMSNMGLSLSASDLRKQYMDLADALRQRDGREGVQGATIMVGGLSKQERENMQENTDLIQPGVIPGMDDNPLANQIARDPLTLRGRW